jgi:hypothetical protein
MLRRTTIAAAWIAGTTIPLLISVVWVFGCCVLPFHGVMHKLMPVCSLAINVMRGEHHDHQQPVPARAKQEPVKRIASEAPRSFRLTMASTTPRAAVSADASTYRSFIAFGALRCDRDVGLYQLTATFLI